MQTLYERTRRSDALERVAQGIADAQRRFDGDSTYDNIARIAQHLLRFYETAFAPAPRLSFLTATYTEAIVHALMADAARARGIEPARGDLLPVMMCTWWGMCGLATFEPSADLVASLLATDCRGLVMGDIKFPHDCFAVKLPFELTFLDGAQQPMRVHTIIASRIARSEFNLPASYSWMMVGTDPDGYGIYWTSLIQAEDAADVAPLVGKPNDADPFRSSRRTLLSLIFNLCLYCSTNTSQLKVRERGTRSPVTKLLRPTVWAVGCPVKLSSTVRDAIVNGNVDSAQTQTWHINKRFIVRGHWRRQVHGKNRADRKLIWVNPFWKGDDREETIKRIYRV